MVFEGKCFPGRIMNRYRNWYLCSTSEMRLKNAINDKAVILVNNHILIKFDGKFSGINVKSGKTADRKRMKLGHWYSPVDPISRQKIREAFDNGLTTVSVQDIQWVHMRKVRFLSLALIRAKKVAHILRENKVGSILVGNPNSQLGLQSRRVYRDAMCEDAWKYNVCF